MMLPEALQCYNWARDRRIFVQASTNPCVCRNEARERERKKEQHHHHRSCMLHSIQQSVRVFHPRSPDDDSPQTVIDDGTWETFKVNVTSRFSKKSFFLFFQWISMNENSILDRNVEWSQTERAFRVEKFLWPQEHFSEWIQSGVFVEFSTVIGNSFEEGNSINIFNAACMMMRRAFHRWIENVFWCKFKRKNSHSKCFRWWTRFYKSFVNYEV